MQQDGKRSTGRGGRGRGRGAGRGKRGRPSIDTSTPVDPEPTAPVVEAAPAETPSVEPMEIVAPAPEPTEAPIEKENAPIDIEADISQLEAPTFTTITRGPPEPMLRLKWNHKVLLIGEKVLNPMIHSCDTCLLPILHYGRMIPCKHVFCLMCAKREPMKECPRCKDKVCRVEQSGLGTVFMCTHGGSRYNNKGCRRTYLSQRDLQAHINHRHVAAVATRPEATATALTAPAAAPEKPNASNTQSGVRNKPIGNTGTTPSNTSSVRNNLMHMQQENIEDGHFTRHSRYSNSHYEASSNWSSSNYR